MVVELGVREHGHAPVELEQRAVGLVGLDDQPLPRPPASVRARRAHLAADEVGRVGAAPAQRVHEHARRRRLPVGAGDRDRRPQPGELGEQVGAVQLALRDRALRVLRADRGRVDDLGALRHVARVVTDDRLDPGLAQPLRVGRAARAVRARHRRAELLRDQRQPAHPRAADADEVQGPVLPWPIHGAAGYASRALRPVRRSTSGCRRRPPWPGSHRGPGWSTRVSRCLCRRAPC